MLLYKNYRAYILQPFLDLYKEWHDILPYHEFSKRIEDFLQMNNICLFDLRHVNTNVFLTYLLSLKQKDGFFLAFLATMVNDQHLCILYLNLAINLIMMKNKLFQK